MRLKQFAAANGGSLNELTSLPPSLIEVEPDFNPRDMDSPEVIAHVRSIADSIKANGYDQNEIMVIRWTGERAFVRDGHCRLAAVALAASEGTATERVPVQPMARGTNEIDDAYKVLTTQTKLPLTSAGWTIQIKKLIASGQSEHEIAKRLGKPESFVTRLLDLAEAPAEVRTAVANGHVSITEAANVLREHGAEQAGAILTRATEAAKARGKTRATARDVAAVTRPRTEPISITSLAETAALAWMEWDGTGALPLSVGNAMDALATRFKPKPKSVAEVGAGVEADMAINEVF